MGIFDFFKIKTLVQIILMIILTKENNRELQI